MPTEDSITIDGVTVERIHGDKWRSPDGRIEVKRILGNDTFRASIDGEVMRSGRHDKWKRFRSAENGVRAAIAELLNAAKVGASG